MSISWKDKHFIDEMIEDLANSRVERFYPTYISKVTKVSLNVAFEYLLQRVDDGTLELLWEVRCPDYECNSVILRTTDLTKILNQKIECVCCEEELLVLKQYLFPTFKINTDFKDYIKSIKKKQLILN
ncbi:hypothetical protein [Bacillus pumilus]|uniref:hypothetical protein n=1 Tax=Bacillus pumilus TaxID=1408 RepID=UPI0024C12BEE|nr:hypothetical protein [Bacillus pumilus]MDH3176509.1 hypothetical protein [Bacillus pumilus]WHX46108.1 hypothetical protein QNH35_06400 [Bacillus pumilus]